MIWSYWVHQRDFPCDVLAIRIHGRYHPVGLEADQWIVRHLDLSAYQKKLNAQLILASGDTLDIQVKIVFAC